MPAFQGDEAEKSDRLKSALWYAVGGIVDAISLDQDINATPQFIGSLTELVWTQIFQSGRDLEAFATHAGRSTVGANDVMLLVRRNEALRELMQACLDDITKSEMKNKK